MQIHGEVYLTNRSLWKLLMPMYVITFGCRTSLLPFNWRRNQSWRNYLRACASKHFGFSYRFAAVRNISRGSRRRRSEEIIVEKWAAADHRNRI